MQIKAEEISQIIEGQIKNYEKKVEMSETGVVLSVGKADPFVAFL